MARSSTSKSPDLLYLLGGLVLVTACLYWARQVLLPVALAILLAFILTPCVATLQQRGLGRTFSALLVVTFALLLLSGVGYVISRQINTLVTNLPSYKEEILRKFDTLRSASKGGFWSALQDLVRDASKEKTNDSEEQKGGAKPEWPEKKSDDKGAKDKVVSQEPGKTPDYPLYVQSAPSGWTRAAEAAGPAAEGLANAFLVVVLVVFMLIQRENLRNRLVRLLGDGSLITTTQAFDESAHRISRYLLMQLLVNTIFGVTLAVGLLTLGLCTGQRVLWQYAALWGLISGGLRFVPYLGTWVAAALVVGFNLATLPGWTLPLSIFGFFLVLELLTANVVEPLLFGHNTGISPMALLLAAAFWTWLWGPVGLVLSTPLTVILVVLGKHVPQLHFFEVLLGDEPVLSRHVTFYQRLVARDLDEASDLIEEYLREHSPQDTYEDVLLPALLMAKRDRDRGDLDSEGYEFALQCMRDTLEDMETMPAANKSESAEESKPTSKAIALGCPGRDEADELALRMFAHVLRLEGQSLEVVSSNRLSAEILDRIDRELPAVVCIGSLPPGGLAQARYLCKRIRRQGPNVKIVIGRWGDCDNLDKTTKRLLDSGADFVAETFHDSRKQIVPLLQVAANTTPAMIPGVAV